jgi:xanthosine utilization system XapX-like protein
MRLALYSLVNGLVVGTIYACIKVGFAPGPILILGGGISFLLGIWCGCGALYRHMEREHAAK